MLPIRLSREERGRLGAHLGRLARLIASVALRGPLSHLRLTHIMIDHLILSLNHVLALEWHLSIYIAI